MPPVFLKNIIGNRWRFNLREQAERGLSPRGELMHELMLMVVDDEIIVRRAAAVRKRGHGVGGAA